MMTTDWFLGLTMSIVWILTEFMSKFEDIFCVSVGYIDERTAHKQI